VLPWRRFARILALARTISIRLFSNSCQGEIAFLSLVHACGNDKRPFYTKSLVLGPAYFQFA